MAQKSLPTLIRVANFDVDEQRRMLGQLLTGENRILEQIASLEQQFAEEKELARTNDEALFQFQAYLQHYTLQKANLHQQLDDMRQQIEDQREVLGEAFRVLKTYELAQRERERIEREEEARKEQDFLNEVGQNIYRRKDDAG